MTCHLNHRRGHLAQVIDLQDARDLRQQPFQQAEIPVGDAENGRQRLLIAKEAQFFSFGTNDLTQTTFGFSRDDMNNILPTYLEEGILKQDPFAALDQEGVGQLVKMATERGRKTRPDLKVGICGEHGGDPASVAFCHEVGLDYVSCSPYRVPIARLAAAQAALGKAIASQA